MAGQPSFLTDRVKRFLEQVCEIPSLTVGVLLSEHVKPGIRQAAKVSGGVLADGHSRFEGDARFGERW